MSITVNGTTINSLNVGNTQVKKVLVRQNAASDYTTVYFVETYEENVTVSGKTQPAGVADEEGTIWYHTPIITKTITSPSGTVEVISAEAVSSSVYSVTKTGASIKVQLRGNSRNTTIDGTVKVTYEVCFSDTQTYEEDITVSGTTRGVGMDYPDGLWYPTPSITHTITSKSGPVKVISAEGVSTSVAEVSIDGASIHVTLRGKDPRSSVTGTVKVTYEACPIPTHNVVQVSTTASQQFKLNSNGYYESQCKGVNNGWSLCKIEFNMAGNYTLQCINNGESNYDFGILSTINNTLQSSNTIDSSNVQKSFKGSSSTSIQSVSYSGVKVGDYIYVKYRKDGSVNDGNDSLQFKIL